MTRDEWLALIVGGFDAFHWGGPESHVESRALDPDVSDARFAREDIVDFSWYVEGRGDGPPWLAMFRLADGRWVYFAHTLQITGDIYWTYIFAADRGRLWWWACTDDDRERLSAAFSAEDAQDELVQLDIMLQSSDPLLRELGETRMARVKLRSVTR